MDKQGPTTHTYTVCDGCAFLKRTNIGNGDYSLRCTVEPVYKYIGIVGQTFIYTPDWCPFMENTNAHS